MDHDHDHGDGGMDMGDGDMDMGCPMIMTFHFSHCETILFKAWTAQTLESFLFSALAIFLISVTYEALKYYREKLYTDTIAYQPNKSCTSNSTSELSNNDKKSIRQLLTSKSHLVQTALHLLQIIISYSLMLIAMTYNLWLIIAILLGAAVGYFLFGWMRQRSIDIVEHCH